MVFSLFGKSKPKEQPASDTNQVQAPALATNGGWAPPTVSYVQGGGGGSGVPQGNAFAGVYPNLNNPSSYQPPAGQPVQNQSNVIPTRPAQWSPLDGVPFGIQNGLHNRSSSLTSVGGPLASRPRVELELTQAELVLDRVGKLLAESQYSFGTERSMMRVDGTTGYGVVSVLKPSLSSY